MEQLMDSPPYLESVLEKCERKKKNMITKHETTTTDVIEQRSAREEKAFWEKETPNNNWEDRETVAEHCAKQTSLRKGCEG